MEDLATGRMSVAQIAQRVIHSSKDSETGQSHNVELVKDLINSEMADILMLLKEDLGCSSVYTEAAERYDKAVKISLLWIKNYLEFNYRSLGSYTRADLDKIASSGITTQP